MTKKKQKTDYYLSSAADEAYKVLRTNIQFCSFDKKIKTITVASCSPSEGKTTTVFNLAESFAKAGFRSLIIDADLRKPKALRFVDGNINVGFSNLISDGPLLRNIIQKSNIENLYFINAGPRPPNPAELLGSEKFRESLENLKGKFDYIVIDTPPLSNFIDSAVIASVTDGTILIIESHKTDIHKAQGVIEQLHKANANILGVVLNKVKKRDSSDYYYDRYYKQNDESGRPWVKDAE